MEVKESISWRQPANGILTGNIGETEQEEEMIRRLYSERIMC